MHIALIWYKTFPACLLPDLKCVTSVLIDRTVQVFCACTTPCCSVQLESRAPGAFGSRLDQMKLKDDVSQTNAAKIVQVFPIFLSLWWLFPTPSFLSSGQDSAGCACMCQMCQALRNSDLFVCLGPCMSPDPVCKKEHQCRGIWQQQLGCWSSEQTQKPRALQVICPEWDQGMLVAVQGSSLCVHEAPVLFALLWGEKKILITFTKINFNISLTVLKQSGEGEM